MINHGAELAKEIIYKYCINSVEELNLNEIINAEGLVIKEVEVQGIYGKLLSSQGDGIIYINRNIREPGMKRFTLAHEFGHFLIFQKRGTYQHIFRGQEYCKNSPEEREANAFAAELLMHKPWFGEFIRNKEIQLDLIEEIATKFNVTLTAAAMRYARIGQFPIAVVLSKNRKIISFFINEYFPYKKLRKSLSKECDANKIIIHNNIRLDKSLIEAYYWFEDEKLKYEKSPTILWEQSIFLKNYDTILTILWVYCPY